MTDSALITTLSPARRRIAFYVLLLGALLPALNMFIVTIALPAIRAGLDASSSETGLIVSGYTSAFGVTLITGGRLGDLFGRKRMFQIGMISFTLMSLICGLSPNAEWLVVARVFQGIAAALMAPAVLAGVRTLFAAEEIAWAMNIYATGIGMAVAGGMFLGGVLMATDAWGLGWRTAFLINVPIGLAAMAAAAFLVPESGGREKPRLDIGGVLLLSAALGSFVVSLSIGREHHWAGWVFALLGASPILLTAFFWYELRLTRRGGMPLLDASLLEIESFRRGLLVALLFFFTTPFYLFFSLYLQAGLGEAALSAGLAILPYGIANFIGPMLASRASARLRPYLFGLGMTLEIIGYGTVGLCTATQTGGIPLFLGLFTAGFGQGVAMPEMINAILGDVPHAHTGLAAGIMTSTLQLGGALSVALIGSLFFAVLGDGTSAADYGHALGASMASQVVIFIAAMLLGLRPAFARRRAARLASDRKAC